LAGPIDNSASFIPFSSPFKTTNAKMLVKTICIIAFAAVSMAAPQFGQDNGDRTTQMQRVEDLRGKGLTCNEAAQETFVCSDGLGGDWSVQPSD
jgi:hypothetical protein